MLGSDYGDDHEYAGTRITGTVVKYRGEPVQVDNVINHADTGVPIALIRELVSQEPSAVNLSDLDLEPFKLGFVNYDVSVSYICRRPMRRDWKQGMRHQNLYSHYGYSPQHIPLSEYYNTLMNNFPTLADCRRILREDNEMESVAWHLNWAVDEDNQVLYKFGQVVGEIDQSGSISLQSKFKHLQEQLEESIV